MLIRKKITVAGNVIWEVLYSEPPRGGTTVVRMEGRKLSREAQRLAKAKTSWQKLDQLFCANLKPGDLVGTFTFDADHMPQSRKQTLNKWSWFLKKLRALRATQDQQLVAFWSPEKGHTRGRYHIHAVINSTDGDDLSELQRLWGQGHVDLKRLERDPTTGFYTPLAKYMAKDRPEKLGQRVWSYTRNVKKPESESFKVPDTEHLKVPDGAKVWEQEVKETPFGRFEVLKYSF